MTQVSFHNFYLFSHVKMFMGPTPHYQSDREYATTDWTNTLAYYIKTLV